MQRGQIYYQDLHGCANRAGADVVPIVAFIASYLARMQQVSRRDYDERFV